MIMKKSMFTLILFVSSILIMSGCKKDESEDINASSLKPGQSQISCTVSGAISSSFKSNSLVSVASKNAYLMNISGGTVSGLSAETVLMILPGTTKTGTYSSATNNSGDFSFAFSKGDKAWSSDPNPVFTVVITKVSATEIEGTFEGTLTNDDLKSQITVKDGKFAAKF